MPHGGRTFTHDLRLRRARARDRARRTARARRIPLEPQTVADFYATADGDAARARARRPHLDDAGRSARTRSASTQDATHRLVRSRRRRSAFHQALLAMKPVLEAFRAGFIGKCSPVHFFWGSFDLAVTRFSGRAAPARPGADAITREAYSHEVISHGWWPGGGPVQRAGVLRLRGARARRPEDRRRSQPAAAFYNTDLIEVHPALRGGADLGDPGGGPAGVPADHLRRRGRAREVGSHRVSKGHPHDRGRLRAHPRDRESASAPRSTSAKTCVKIGARWVHLRTCQTCGVTLCCDSSPNRHASKHARDSAASGRRVGRARRAVALLLPDDAFAEY